MKLCYVSHNPAPDLAVHSHFTDPPPSPSISCRIAKTMWKAACLASMAFVAADASLEAEVARLQAEVHSLRKAMGKPTKTDADMCSGNGYYYGDVSTCVCFTCFSGDSCESFDDTCVLDDGPGNPFLFEEYWRNASLTTESEIYYRTPYELVSGSIKGQPDQKGGLLPLLVKTILRLHAKVNNIANLEKKSVVIGSGGTELIGAASWACKQLHGQNSDFYLAAQAPYYSGYTANYVGLGAANYTFVGPNTAKDASKVAELVTYPNNPTNEFRKPMYPNAACTIHDQVYWWPSLSNLSEGGAPLDTSISMFSMSKLTGHAGTRLGWALVDDPKMAALMGEYISGVQLHVSVDAMHRSQTVLSYLVDKDNLAFFDWARETLTRRWEIVNAFFEKHTDRFRQHAKPIGFYAWVECLHPEEQADCQAVFRKALVGPKQGSLFGGTDAFIRMEMVQPDVVFNKMIDRLMAM